MLSLSLQKWVQNVEDCGFLETQNFRGFDHLTFAHHFHRFWQEVWWLQIYQVQQDSQHYDVILKFTTFAKLKRKRCEYNLRLHSMNVTLTFT